MRPTYALRTTSDLAPGDHVCCLYERDEERRSLLTPYVRQGLERGEKVLYVVGADLAEAVLGYLRDDGLAVDPHLISGQMSIFTVDEAFKREGVSGPEGMITLLRSESERALAEGYTALRVTGEMTWALAGLPDSNRLIGYEAMLNTFFHDSKCLGICLYDRRRFDPAVLLDVLATHPMVVVGAELYDNLYYVPPSDYHGRDLPAATVRHWLENLKNMAARIRAEETLRRTHDQLEQGVQERTAELSKAIDVLQEQIAERQRVEEQLRRSEDQLRALSGHLRAVQEEERARIAREVHDELGQALTALKFDLAWVGQRLAGGQKELHTKVQTMTRLIDETMQGVRRIATELRPGLLDHLGLVPALEWQVREFQERTGLTCEFKKNPEHLVVHAARATTVFRICQEALTNVARHAQATKVGISLRMAGRKLVLEVRDNGRGISEDAVTDPQSVGLLGMRERVLSWGGVVQIQGIEGKGTVVTVHLPAGDREVDLPGGLS
ncbi:MAG: MEDS domain-containing protein [Candidatus Methylomirabilales bacterium]